MQANAVAAVSPNGSISAIMHPVGFMYKNNEIINVQANDMRLGNHKLDTICGYLHAVLSTDRGENVLLRISKTVNADSRCSI